MVAKKAAAKKDSDPNVEELLSPDIWTNNKCILCQDVCASRESKIAHGKTPRHSRKSAIYKFFTNDCNQNGLDKPSLLFERYKDKGHEAVGLESLHELVFPFAESGWWACSLCYDAGSNYDQVDEHLTSAHHLQCYLDEFHPAKLKKMEKGWSQTERLEFLLDVKKQIHHEEMAKGGGVIAPEIIELSGWTLQMARKKLVVDDTRTEYAVHAVTDDSSNVMMQCQTCFDTLPCRKDYVDEVWRAHKATERHTRLAAIQAILRQYHFDKVQEDDRMLSELSEETIRWKRVDDRVYGPVCGIKYLRTMGGTSLCTLCGVVANGVDEHFASEIHLMRFVSLKAPCDTWQMMQTSKEARREKLLQMLQGAPRENEESRATKEACPSRLSWHAVESESEQLPSFPPAIEPLGFNSTCMPCQSCWLVVPIPAGEDSNVIWNEHVSSNDHLDYSARRRSMEYDESYFVPMASSVTLLEKDPHGKWMTEAVGEQVTWKYQTQTDVGLEYVVEDADQGLAVCTLCARTYPLEEHCQMGRHVRSVQHLQQYMHVTERTMLSMVLESKKEQDADELMLEYILRNTVTQMDEIRVFNKKKAKELESWPNVRIRTMAATSYGPVVRPTFECLVSMVDQIAKDEGEKQTMSAREALQAAGMREIAITKPNLQNTGHALFRCKHCEMCLVVEPSQLEADVWEKHVSSEEHHRRITAFAGHKFAPIHFTPLSSTYTVKPFVQKDPTKKVTWRWNALDKTHDLVLAIVGLEDVIEKKSDDVMVKSEAIFEDFTAHFFCRLCAVVVGRRAQLLEDHVRSAAHVYAYVNKHFPQTVLELDRLDNNDGGKERRKILATLLKDIKPPADYCIPLYDPVGESERRLKEAEIKHKQRESMRKNEEMRKAALEERKRLDEEKRRILQKEKEREEERKKREAVVMEKANAINAMREQQRKVAMEKEALAAIARKKEEKARIQNQLTRDPAIAQLLNKRNEVTAQLEALRAAKAAGAVPEPRLIIPGPNQLATQAPVILPAVSAPVPVPQPMLPNMALPPPGMFPVPPPMGMPGMPGMQPTPFSMPPPSLMNTMVPPPQSMAVPPPSVSHPLDLVGPKPVISSFVPKVDAMPVYPTTKNTTISPGAKKRDFERPSLAGAVPDMYATNALIIANRQALVDYMWKQGNEETPESERPARFSRLCAATPACLGMETIYEVVCLDSGDLTTMYCSMCGYWTTPMDMVKHMLTPSHRLLYLFRNYKLYHRTVESEVDTRAKEILLEQFATQIRSRDNPPPCVTHRLKCYLNTATIQRLWPQYVTILDQSWRSNPVCRTPSPPPRRRGRSRSRTWSRSRSRSRTWSRSRSRSPKDRYGRRSRSRDRDSRRRSRSRSRGRDGNGRRRSYSRSRSATPVQKTWHPETMAVPPRATAAPMPMMMGGPGGMMNMMMPNMSVPPPGIMPAAAAPQPVMAVTLPAKHTIVTLPDSDDDMQIVTSPSPDSKKEKKGEERGRGKDKDRERGDRREKESKSSTPQKERDRRRDRDGGKRDKERERDREKRKEKEEELDPVREEQRKKAIERVRDLERQKKEQKEREKEKETEEDRQRRRKDRRDRSRERRGRSPSPSSRKRRRSRSESRERRSSHRSSNGNGDAAEIDWDAKAAAFLAKIGDLTGASKLIQGGSAAASASPYGVPPPSLPAYNGGHASTMTTRPDSGMGGSMLPDADFGAAMAGGSGGMRKKDTESPDYEPLESSPPPRAAHPPSAAAAGEDPETTKRKLLGVLVTMQKETEAGRELSERDVDRIYKEVGLVNHAGKNDALLAQLIDMVGGGGGAGQAPAKKTNINLQDYGIGGSGSSPAQQQQHQQQQHHGSPYYGAPPPSRGPPPAASHAPPGYGGSTPGGGGDYYGGPAPSSRHDARVPSALASMDAEGLELLKNLSSTLKLMQSRGQGVPSAGPGGPRPSLPMPPGFGRRPGEDEYGRREAYPPPSAGYPAYRSPPIDEDARLRRPAPAYDPYLDPRGPDPRMREQPPRPYGVPPGSQAPDPRYAPPRPVEQQRSYYDDPYDRAPAPPPQHGGYGAYDRDLRAGLARDPRDAHAPPPPSRAMMDNARLYERPPERAERPVLTREEYEARLRGEIPPSQPTGSVRPPPKGAGLLPTPAPAPAASKPAAVVTIDDDDDWGALEQILDKAKGGAAAAKKAGPPGASPSAAAAAAPQMSAAEAEKEAHKLRTQQGIARRREQWGVRNKAEPAPQPHLGPPKPPLQFIGGDPAPTRNAPHGHQQQQQPTHIGGVAIGGAWDAAYAAQARPPPQQQQQQPYQQPPAQQQQQSYYGNYSNQNGGGYGGYY